MNWTDTARQLVQEADDPRPATLKILIEDIDIPLEEVIRKAEEYGEKEYE